MLGSGALALDALELPLVDLFGDLPGVVALEQLALLSVELLEEAGRAGDLSFGYGDQTVEAVVDHRPDAFPAGIGELYVRVVAHDGVLDQLDRVVALRAGLELAPAANEVVEGVAAASDVAREDQPAAALAAVQRPLEVVVMDPLPLAGQPLGRELILNPLEQREGDQMLVPPRVGVAPVVDNTDVVVVAQQRLEPIRAQGLGRRARCRTSPQAALFQQHREIRQRVFAGRVQLERLADQRRAFGVERDCADLAAVDHLPHVEVADGGSGGRAPSLGLLSRSFEDLGCQVARVELGDRGHDAVQQHSRRCLVDVFGYRNDLRAGSTDARHDGNVVGSVAGKPVDLVHEDIADAWVTFYSLQHGLQGGTICRLRRMGTMV